MSDDFNTGAKLLDSAATKFEGQVAEFSAALDLALAKARDNSDQDIIDVYAVVKRVLDRVSDAVDVVEDVFEKLKTETVPNLLMEKDEFGGFAGYRSFSSEQWGYRISVRTDTYPSIAEGQHEAAFNFLKENNYGASIKETIHAKTLGTIYREIQEKEDLEIPDGMFNVHKKTIATVNKK